jgi:hypothetical protein
MGMRRLWTPIQRRSESKGAKTVSDHNEAANGNDLIQRRIDLFQIVREWKTGWVKLPYILTAEMQERLVDDLQDYIDRLAQSPQVVSRPWTVEEYELIYSTVNSKLKPEDKMARLMDILPQPAKIEGVGKSAGHGVRVRRWFSPT